MILTGDTVKDRNNGLEGVVTAIRQTGVTTRLARFTPDNRSLPGYWVDTLNLSRRFRWS